MTQPATGVNPVNDYYGQPTGRLENEHLILDYLLAAGPRIVRLIPKSLGENLLAETPEAMLASPHGPCRLWGGHRLWHAPETAARTYLPDDSGLSVAPLVGGVRLIQDEPRAGIRKEIAVRLRPEAAGVRLEHRLTNTGLWPVELAPWAITQLRLGGVASLPTTSPADDEGLLPDRIIALWPYSRWSDPRFRPGDEAIEIAALPIAQPFKVGFMSHAGRMDYRYGDLVFTKRWTPQSHRPHVDFGCNAEVYTNDRHIELETLGPVARLDPGETVDHVEEWEIASSQWQVE
jgi:hypothetical protein